MKKINSSGLLKYIIGGIGIICIVFLASCSEIESIKESSEKKQLSKEETVEKFSSFISESIYARTFHKTYPAKDWDKIISYYSTDIGMLHIGYGKEGNPCNFNQLCDRLKLQSYKHEEGGHISIFFSKEDDLAFRKGIKHYEEEAKDKYNSAKYWLASFYFQTESRFKNIERGLFWSYKDAESGEIKVCYI
ncbi:MAG: hypothetical protein JSS09_02820 [Verrucomicrobia bacterium]|nr:hypothetical protein [Verrucomicrobiota bacterium]